MERIAIEFEKLMAGPAYKRALSSLMAAGIHAHLPDMDRHLLEKVIDDDRRPVNALGGWALFLHHVGDANWLIAWKRSNATKREATRLAELLETGLDTFAVYDTPVATLDTYLQMVGRTEQASDLKRQLPIQHRSELRFNGRDALDIGASGATIKHLLAYLERAVLHGELPNEATKLRKEACAWLRHEERS